MKSTQILLCLLVFLPLVAAVEDRAHQQHGERRGLRKYGSASKFAHSTEATHLGVVSSASAVVNDGVSGKQATSTNTTSENKEDDDEEEEQDDGSDADDEKDEISDQKGKTDKEASRAKRQQRAQDKLDMDRDEEAALAVAKAHDRLDENQHKQAQINADLSDLSDEKSQRKEVDASVKLVANETQSKSLAYFLGDMWREMRMFATPFYEEHLEEDLVDLVTQEAALKQQLETARATRDGLHQKHTGDEEQGAKDEKAQKEPEDKAEQKASGETEPQEKVSLAPPEAKKATAEPEPEAAGVRAGEYQAMFTSRTMPAVSPTLSCVMNLTWQYFLVYTALALVRTVLDQMKFQARRLARLEKVLVSCCGAVTYAPMLCVLFLGTRMRAIQLSQGQTERYALPQSWVQACMFLCTYAVLAHVVVVAVIGILFGSTDAEDAKPPAAKVLGIVNYTILLALYIGAGSVCVGAILMKGPAELWGTSAPPVSPAVQCTMILTTVFFIVYLGHSICSMARNFRSTPLLEKLELVFKAARSCVNLAPMLCILFIAARVRALQIDPKYGNPQPWAQRCFYTCTFGVVVLVIMAIVFPLVDKEATVEQSEYAAEIVVFKCKNTALLMVGTVLRYVALVSVYAGACAVMASVFLIQSPQGFEVTPPVSPAMQCVIGLACQYFLVATTVFVLYTVAEFLADHKKNTKANVLMLLNMFEDGMKSVMFAPMLSILFVAARMRALQLTRTVENAVPPTAGPQAWAQEGMYLATWSVLLQLVMTILSRLMAGHAHASDESGKANKTIALVLDVVKYLCLLAMYGGAVVVMVAIFQMTPETLPPYSQHQTLIPGVSVPPPPTVPPQVLQ